MPKEKNNQPKTQCGRKKKKSNGNTGISKYLSITTLNVNGHNAPKDTDDWIESKGKIQQSVVYKKHTS
jgi:hypothetical protein